MGVHFSKEDNPSICAAFCFVFFGRFFSIRNIVLYSSIKTIWILLMIAQIIVASLEKNETSQLVTWSYVGAVSHIFATLFIMLPFLMMHSKNVDLSCSYMCFSFLFGLLNVAWIIIGILFLLVNDFGGALKIMSIISLCFSWMPFLMFVGGLEK